MTVGSPIRLTVGGAAQKPPGLWGIPGLKYDVFGVRASWSLASSFFSNKFMKRGGTKNFSSRRFRGPAKIHKHIVTAFATSSESSFERFAMEFAALVRVVVPPGASALYSESCTDTR